MREGKDYGPNGSMRCMCVCDVSDRRKVVHWGAKYIRSTIPIDVYKIICTYRTLSVAVLEGPCRFTAFTRIHYVPSFQCLN